MSTQNDGGPAFPTCESGLTMAYVTGGMSLRDWFAGMAMQGLLASEWDFDAARIGEKAYAQADAMLARREQN